MSATTPDERAAASIAGTTPPGGPVVEPGIEWVRPRPDARGYRNDAVLAVVVAGLTTISVLLYDAAGAFGDVDWWWRALWVAGIALPLAARRRFPEIVLLVITVVFAVGAINGVGEVLFSNITLFMAFYAVGAWGGSRLRANIVRGVVAVGMIVWLIWQSVYFSAIDDYLPEITRSGEGMTPYVAYSLVNLMTNLLYFGGGWFFGDTAYRAARARAALEQRTAELAAERERTRTQAVALERVRIARELHDVVAHHVSVMGVQAGAARFVLERDPASAAASLEAIEANARDAVDELHRLLGTLRSPADAEAPDAGSAASTRGLEQVPHLVDEVRAAGLPVTFEIVGGARAVPQLVGLSAYRIVQEALTNVRKHAGAAATAEVRLRYLADAVEVEVVNTGQVRTDAGGSGAGGLGQLGMRERVAAVGGALDVGPRPRGGYRVRAALPTSSTSRAPDAGAAPGGEEQP